MLRSTKAGVSTFTNHTLYHGETDFLLKLLIHVSLLSFKSLHSLLQQIDLRFMEGDPVVILLIVNSWPIAIHRGGWDSNRRCSAAKRIHSCLDFSQFGTQETLEISIVIFNVLKRPCLNRLFPLHSIFLQLQTLLLEDDF